MLYTMRYKDGPRGVRETFVEAENLQRALATGRRWVMQQPGRLFIGCECAVSCGDAILTPDEAAACDLEQERLDGLQEQATPGASEAKSPGAAQRTTAPGGGGGGASAGPGFLTGGPISAPTPGKK